MSGATSDLPTIKDFWFFDSGGFLDWKHDKPFDGDRYTRDMERIEATPYFALLPDILGKGEESLDLSVSYISKVRDDWDYYLVVQDGMTVEMVEDVIDSVAGLFLGGTNAFKGEAKKFSDLAHRHGKLFHYGRAGTLRKLRYARHVADSMDSAFPLFTVERFNLFHHWVTNTDPQSDWIEQHASQIS